MKVAFKIADRVAMALQGPHHLSRDPGPRFQASPNPNRQQFIDGRAEGPLTRRAS